LRRQPAFLRSEAVKVFSEAAHTFSETAHMFREAAQWCKDVRREFRDGGELRQAFRRQRSGFVLLLLILILRTQTGE
jgi:hypothetical protein